MHEDEVEYLERLGLDRNDIERVYLCSVCISKFYYYPLYISDYCDFDYTYREVYNFNWNIISMIPNLPRWFIEKYESKLDWWLMSTYQNLPLDLIEKHKDKVNWTDIVMYRNVPANFVSKYGKNVDYDYISLYRRLDEKFITEYITYLTEKVFDNKTYKYLPDSLKLLLRQKFAGKEERR